MASPATIRGHQAFFKIFQNGQEVIIDSITRVSINQDSNFSRHHYVGNAYPQGDQTMMGWSGNIQMEVRDDSVERFLDALIANNLNGIDVSAYTLMVVERYSDGSEAVYGYFDCQFKYSREAGGLDSKVTKTLDFQAGGRVRI